MASIIPRTSGIYVIVNTKNGKVYIGQAQDLRDRWYKHKATLNNGCHRNMHLQRAWNKYGERAFKFQIIERCPVEQLDEREQHYLDVYIPKGICYNIATDAKASFRGRKKSADAVEKTALAHRGVKKKPESIIKRTAARSQQWIVTSPNGEEMEICNLSLFCRINGLNQAHMWQVANGSYSQHKGWKCRYV